MSKLPSLIAKLSCNFLLYCFFFQQPGSSQELPGCFMIDRSGEVISLDSVCERSEGHGLRTIENSRGLYQRGFTQAREGLLEEAIANFTQSINADPNYVESYIARAYAQTRNGNIDGGIEDFERVVDILNSRGELERADMFLETLQNLRRGIATTEED